MVGRSLWPVQLPDCVTAVRESPEADLAAETEAVLGATPIEDDLSREVYCVLGLPIDATDMAAVLHKVEAHAVARKRFLISTPNLNFLVNYQLDADFRNSLLLSDLCPADGMPILWIARFTGVPIKTRVPGSDFFDMLKVGNQLGFRLKVFLFGGGDGVAAAASEAINAGPGGLFCVGSIFPGFGTVDEMSTDKIIDEINASDADFLVASLGAKKGQAWLQRNHARLRIPIRAHLGAAINFEAGRIKRAPTWMRRRGLEWLWRIKEEPYLWRRYLTDGSRLVGLLLTRGIPLALEAGLLPLMRRSKGQGLSVMHLHDNDSVTLRLSGDATASHVQKAIECFRDVLIMKKQVVVDFSETRVVDARFLGLLLMLRKCLHGQGITAKFVGMSPGLARTFRLHGLGFLVAGLEAA
jgi:N-acetylglucosaminyldiphosphoundecaprenol N-acetyl-beta-D-mannosaminyltransferase